MAFEDWKKCPVDGTRFFYASESYPHGRPHGARYCSGSCEAQAGSRETYRKGSASYGAFYIPEVDGTLGTATERENGGPLHMTGVDVRPRREYVNLPGDGITARPLGGGDLGNYSDLIEGSASGAARGGRH